MPATEQSAAEFVDEALGHAGVSVAAKEYGQRIAKRLLINRKGHGNGPCTRRVFDESELIAFAAIAFDAGRKSVVSA